jgi:hypothetical protein
LNLEITGNTISNTEHEVSEDFSKLVKLAESAKFGTNVMRVYPNTNSVLDINFAEETKVSLNGKVLESNNIESALIAGGFVKFTETDKLGMIQRAINEGSKIKDIEFGYKVTSSVFEGLSVSVFNVEDRIFIQKVNKGMKENSIVESSATDAVKIVKDFMNYDISESLNSLLENEKAESERRTAELNKIEDQIKFIIEKLSDIEAAEKTLGKSEFIDQAKELIESQLKEQNAILKQKIANETQNLFPELDIPKALYTKAYLWRQGCSYWLPGNYDYREISKQALYPMPETYPNLHIVGESFSQKQQWVEGALEHADQLVKLILETI